MDEYPPAYFLHSQHTAALSARQAPPPGQRYQGQFMRYLDGNQNEGVGSLWRGFCMKAPLLMEPDVDIVGTVRADPREEINSAVDAKDMTTEKTIGTMIVGHKAEFSF
ncbi:hypothetical protein QBC38DRAFT_501397 [Podospora fimiseda]|uniref:Uncharacterized protein n=1 Tax=Podospora fimiseda TaxID=252190 RepID=A0AAN7BL51_9PEZI|nr:hypothetical protein QBC38DRAFT_501397 [Podospora fimiseda]